MKTKAVMIYGKNDLRLEEFELPKIKDDEILASVITDSLCMSTWKLAQQGGKHKKAPDNLQENPIMVGHEICGELLEVGSKWKDQFEVGQKYVIQANLLLEDRPDCPGYSYKYTGGDATYIILDRDVMNQGCLITYNGDTYYEGSLIEPLSTVIGAFEAQYHTKKGSYDHIMGIKPNGNLLIMGGTGPMGLLAIDYALHGPIKPKNIIVTDIDKNKLERAEKLYPSEPEINVSYVDVSDLDMDAQVNKLKEAVGGDGYDDIFLMVPSKELVSISSKLLNEDGCGNFFAGPSDSNFTAEINFYDIHYSQAHYVGTSGGNVEDVKRAVKLIEEGKVKLSNVVTHILGLNAVADTTLRQPEIGGGKKLVYTHKNIDLTKLSDIPTNSDLGKILQKNDGIWNKEAEDYIIKNAEDI